MIEQSGPFQQPPIHEQMLARVFGPIEETIAGAPQPTADTLRRLRDQYSLNEHYAAQGDMPEPDVYIFSGGGLSD